MYICVVLVNRDNFKQKAAVKARISKNYVVFNNVIIKWYKKSSNRY